MANPSEAEVGGSLGEKMRSDPIFDPPVDRMRDRATKGAVVIGLAQAGKLVVQFLSVITLARLLSPSDFGLVAMIGPLLGFLGMLQDLGLSQAVIQHPRLTRNQASWFFWLNTAVGVGIGLFLLGSAALIGAFYKDVRITHLVQASALTMVISGLGAQHGALLSRQMKFATSAALDAGSALLGFLVTAAAAWYTHSFWALFIGSAAMIVFQQAGAWVAVPWIPSWPRKDPEIRQLFGFGAGMTTFNLANFVARNLDNVLIGKAWGPVSLGLYDRAYKLLLFPMQQVYTPLSKIMLPTLSRLADNPARYRSAFVRTASLLVLVTQPGVIFLILTDDWLTPILLGKEWASAAPIFTCLGLAALIQTFNGTLGWLFVSQGRAAEFGRWGVIAALTCAIAFVVGLPWGPVGVALGYGLSEIFVRTPMLWLAAGRSGPVSRGDIWRAASVFIAPMIFAAGAVALFRQLFHIEIYLSLVICLVLSYSVYAGVMALSREGRTVLGWAWELATHYARPGNRKVKPADA